MPTDRDGWSRLKDLFNSLLDRHGEDRAELLDRVSREHPDLADQLRVLLAAHDDADDFLEQPAYADAPTIGVEGDPFTIGDAHAGVLTAGEILDHTYEVEAVLGQGGMGVVYRVRHRALARTFAAKLIHAPAADAPAFHARFAREAEALGKLKHPHIVDVTDFGIDRGRTARPYLVMEYLAGPTLDEHVRSGPLDVDAALTLFEDIAAALNYAHEQGVLHLDLKPGNILVLDAAGDRPSAKILDFGLAQFLTSGTADPVREPDVVPIGTPAYMAPELWRGERPGPAADIYALGVLMYEVLVGRRPFQGPTAEIARQVRDAAPPLPSSLNPAISAEVDDALMAALAKQPSGRPATALAAVDHVRRAALAARQRHWRQIETPRRLAAAVAIATVLTAVMALWPSSPFRAWEQWTVDTRFALAGSRAPGGDIVLLLLDEGALQASSLPLAQRADQFGVDLQRVFDAGARAVAVDFLLPASWSNSAAFTQLVLRHADRLTLAAFSSASGDVVGPECVGGLITAGLGQERVSALFGFVNLDQDSDGVSRRARISYRDREGRTRSSFAGHTASIARPDLASPQEAAETGEFWIDHTVDGGRFERVSWMDLEATLRARPELFRNRVVFVGGDYSGSGDRALVPNHGTIPGVVLHALITETILSEYPVRSVGSVAVAIAAGVTCVLVCATLLLTRTYASALPAVLLVMAAHVGGALLLFHQAAVMVPIVGPLLVLVGGTAAAWLVRRSRQPFPRA